MYLKLVTLIFAFSGLSGCNGESKEESELGSMDFGLAETCSEGKIIHSKIETSPPAGFGSGVDGEFYLSYGETFYLEEGEYNFTNVNLDSGSLLGVANGSIDGTGIIQINSLGICNIFGDIDISGYSGGIALNCYSGITIGGVLTHPDGDLTLTTADTIDISGGELNVREGGFAVRENYVDLESINISQGLIIGISGGELNVREGGFAVGENYVGLESIKMSQGLTNCSN